MTGSHWTLHETEQGRYCSLPALSARGLVHGFSCRDLGAVVAPAAPQLLSTVLGLEPLPRVRLEQRHTPLVHAVGPGHAFPEPPPVGDALVALEAGWALSLWTADCLPLLLVDGQGRRYGAVHAGWRGTLAGVLGAALEVFQRDAATDHASAWLAIGPGIRACCFEVGDEVAAQFLERWPGAEAWLRPGAAGRPHLDLASANRFQAEEAGIRADRIIDPGLCTRCRRDLFFSYRGDGGTTGRIVTVAGIPRQPARRAPAAT